MTPPVVIIGTGLAGYTLARELRRLDKTTPLLLLTEDDGSSYYKPVLSNALTSGKTPETIPLADAAQMARQLDADIRPFTPVVRLDPQRHVIATGNGTVQYRQLVLAVGADPIHVPVEGDAGDRIFSVNNLTDYRRFRPVIEAADNITIMGAGLIGCEFANDLPAAGVGVDVVDPAGWPLSRFLPERAGRVLQERLETAGVNWHFGCVVQLVERCGARLRITLSDGSSFETDAVLSAIGLRPRTRLAADSGLAVNHGIVVDGSLQTSVRDIYALGDCAEVEGLVLPFVLPIMHAARSLARTLTGQPTPVRYPAMPVVVKTTRYPVVVAPPPAAADGEWTIDETAEGIEALFHDRDQRLQGFALTGTAVNRKNALTKALPPLLTPQPQ